MKKALIIALAALVVLLVAAGLYYHAIQRNHYDRIEQVSQLALAHTELAEIGKVERFAGEKVYYVVTGTDDAGHPLIVWVSDDETTVHSAVYGITADDAVALAKRHHGEDVIILRVVPGMLTGEPVWEVYYERDEGDGTRRFYDYYRYYDGMKLDTLRLNVQK